MARVTLRDYTSSPRWNGSTGSAQSVAAVDYSAYNKLVVDVWINPVSFATEQVIFEVGPAVVSTAGGFVLYAGWPVVGKLSLIIGAGDGATYTTVTASIIPRFGKWSHVVAVFDRTASAATCLKVYVNGVLCTTAHTASYTPSGNFASGQKVNVGARAVTTKRFAGGIKDIRVHTFTTFADADAVTLYADNHTPAGFTLVDRWGLEETSSPAADSVRSANLTLTNLTFSDDVPYKARTSATRTTTVASRTDIPTLQNLFLRSEELSNAAFWDSSGGVTVTTDQATAPDGTVTADLLDAGTAASSHFIGASSAFVCRNGESVTHSVYVKPGTGRYFQMFGATGAFSAAGGHVNFDLQLGTVAQSNNGLTGSIVALANGWFRIAVTGTTIAALTSATIWFCPVNSGTATRQLVWTPSNETYYLWGMQRVRCNWLSPYVKTIASVVDTGNLRNVA